MEQGVIFIDDDPEPENASSTAQSWETESKSQAAEISSSCCVSACTQATLVKSNTDLWGQGYSYVWIWPIFQYDLDIRK